MNLEDMTKEELVNHIKILEKALRAVGGRLSNAEVNLALMEAQMPSQEQTQMPTPQQVQE